MGSPAPLAFSAFNGNLAVDASGSSLLGRMRVSWAVNADPAAFELAIQQNGVNMTGRVYSLAGSKREQLITGLADGSGVYSAVISARNASNLVVASQSKEFNVKHAAAGDMQLAGSCAPATGVVTVTFNPIPDFAGPYTVSCNGVVKDVSNGDVAFPTSSVIFPFMAEKLDGAELSLSTNVDGIALGDFTANVVIDRQVRYNTFSVTQTISQAKQGKATVNYTTSFADSNTKYILEVSGGSGWSTLRADGKGVDDISNNDIISKIAGNYDFRLKAVGASLDSDLTSAIENVTIQKTLVIPAMVAGSASGKVTVSADDIGATSSVYTFDVSGGAADNAMNASDPHVGSIVLPDGDYQIQVKVENNGETAMSTWKDVFISKTSVISNMAINKRMYAGLGKVELTWYHTSSSGACAYVAKLRKASDDSQVADASMNLAADAASGNKTLELSVTQAGAYIARLEVTINGDMFSDEVIVYLENVALNMNLQASAVNRTDNAGLTNPYDLSFTRAAGLAESLFAYSWSLTASGDAIVPVSVAASALISFPLPRTASLDSGKTYTFRVSTTLYGVEQSVSKSFLVGTVAHKSVVVDLGVALDARADAAVLDAEAPTVSGNVVTCNVALPAAALYGDASDGLIEFWEPSDADAIGTIDAKFTVNANGSGDAVWNGLNYAKKLVKDMHSCLTGALDCSAALPFNRLGNRSYDQYASVGDMTLGYIADKLFGHPAATAAITNDAHIKATMNASPGATAAAVDLGSGSVAIPSLNTSTAAGDQKLALRLVQTMLFANNVAGDASPAARATRIANSVIGQDADRARDADNNKLAPAQSAALPFYAGDILFFKLTLKSLDVFQGRHGDPIYTALKARLANQDFTFKITLA